MLRWKSGATILLVLTTLLVLAACQPQQAAEVTVPPPTTEQATATALPSATATPLPTDTAMPTETITPAPTLPPATATTPPLAQPKPTHTPTSEAPLQVVYVNPDDVLNVRQSAGADAELAGALLPGSTVTVSSGEGRMANDHLWLPVSGDETSGWVNSLYLTEVVSDETFCDAREPLELLESLRDAVASKETQELMRLVSERRGLRVRTSWWNPEVRLADARLQSLFGQGESYEWGHEDGSGRPIEGSFAEVILPLLERDLSGATEVACNEILHGATAGTIQLPAEYEGVNFYSLYRPAGPEEIEFDWGSWVVGIERWQGQYRVAFLVHFAYEI